MDNADNEDSSSMESDSNTETTDTSFKLRQMTVSVRQAFMCAS